MPIDPTVLANIKALSFTGRPAVCEYIKATWDTGVIHYYSGAAWHNEAPFTSIGQTIEARIKFPNTDEPLFYPLEINPDLRAELVDVVFNDVDGAITDLFQTYSSGVTLELFRYYSDYDETVSLWTGRLQAPDDSTEDTVKTKITNGQTSRELWTPRRDMAPDFCTFEKYGGDLPSADAIASNGCPMDLHVGGSTGLVNPSTGLPYVGCPRTKGACIARLDMNSDGIPEYYGAFETDAAAMVTDTKKFYLAISNPSKQTEPLKVVFGTATVKNLPVALWRREVNQSTPAHGFVSGLFIVGEGPVQSMYNFKINDVYIGQEHLNFRLGTRGQPKTAYAPNVSNLSSTAHVFARYGWVNAAEISAQDLNAECIVQGYSRVCVYTDDSPVTKTRQWSDDRVWCLLEIYKNQTFGLGYDESKFEILDWMTASTWGQQTVEFTALDEDGGTVPYAGRRTTFNAVLEGRPAGEQIEDICRSGGLSVPFWHEGKLTITPFTAFTSGQLSAAPVFYDRGDTTQAPNICWSGDQNNSAPSSGGGKPLLKFSYVKDEKLINLVNVRYEDAAKNGSEVAFKVRDKNQQLKAGRDLGADHLKPVPKDLVGFGITQLQEAVRFGHRILKYGQFDEGGTDNNLKAVLTVPYEQALGVKRYGVIKIVSSKLSRYTLAKDTAFEETPEYFRVLKLQKIAGNRMEITAQAYNQTSYEAFETDSVVSTSTEAAEVYGAGAFIVDDLYPYVMQMNSKPYYSTGSKEIYWASSKWRISVDGVQYYESPNNVAFPWLASFVSTAPDGVDPAPLVHEGPHLRAGGEVKTLSGAAYDSVTGLVTIHIDA